MQTRTQCLSISFISFYFDLTFSSAYKMKKTLAQPAIARLKDTNQSMAEMRSFTLCDFFYLFQLDCNKAKYQTEYHTFGSFTVLKKNISFWKKIPMSSSLHSREPSPGSRFGEKTSWIATRQSTKLRMGSYTLSALSNFVMIYTATSDVSQICLYSTYVP